MYKKQTWIKRLMLILLIVLLSITSVNTNVETVAMAVDNGIPSGPITHYYQNQPYRIDMGCVYFGNYYQEDTNGDGVANENDSKTPIKWRVITYINNYAVLVSDKILDRIPYNENPTGIDIKWKECSLRKWLNIDFYNAAFSEEEKNCIQDNYLRFYDMVENSKCVMEKSKADMQNILLGNEPVIDEITDKVGIENTSTTNMSSRLYSNKLNNDRTIAYTYAPTAYAVGKGVASANSSCWVIGTETNVPHSAYSYLGEYEGNTDMYFGGIRTFTDLNEYLEEEKTCGVCPVICIDINSDKWTLADSVYKPNIPIHGRSVNKRPIPIRTPIPNQSVNKRPDLSKQIMCNKMTAFARYVTVNKVANYLTIKGKLSVSGAKVKIKVDKNPYKKAVVKGKRFCFKMKLKRSTYKWKYNTIIKATKKGYKSLNYPWKIDFSNSGGVVGLSF